MCYNAEVSLNTFIYGCVSAIIVYYLKVIPLHAILILLSVTFIQFVEFLTWTYYDNPKINRYLSILAFVTIVIQLILLNYFLPNKKSSRILLTLLFVFAVLFIIFQLRFIDFRMKIGKNKHLAWYWLDLPLIWIIIGLSFYIIPALLGKYKSTLIFIMLILLVSIYYHWKYKTWGSMWCYFSNIGWILLIAISIKPSLSFHLI